MKDRFYRYMESIDDIDREIVLFWNQNMKYIHRWYLHNQSADDVVISASPTFLVAEACRRLNITYVLGSQVDKKTGHVLGPNCHDIQKVIVFHEAGFTDDQIEDFYSDSYSDEPMALRAQRSFIVEGENLKKWGNKQ